MTQLKTLKDFSVFEIITINDDILKTEFSVRTFSGRTKDDRIPRKILEEDNNRMILMSDLKQEAIKWIKELDNASSKICPETFLNNNSQLQEWIKHFFNITEEDLK